MARMATSKMPPAMNRARRAQGGSRRRAGAGVAAVVAGVLAVAGVSPLVLGV